MTLVYVLIAVALALIVGTVLYLSAVIHGVKG